MKEILPNIFAVEVPDGANGFDLYKHEDYCALTFYEGKPSFQSIRDKQLSPGSYEILFTTKDCTEEQAATLPMEDSGINFGYKDYEGKQSSHFYADHALLSLLRSRSLDPKNKNYLLLKKIS